MNTENSTKAKELITAACMSQRQVAFAIGQSPSFLNAKLQARNTHRISGDELIQIYVAIRDHYKEIGDALESTKAYIESINLMHA